MDDALCARRSQLTLTTGPLLMPGMLNRHGLSYTTFVYSSLRVSSASAVLSIRNNGSVAGAEVVQLYIAADPQTSTIARPKKELKGFKKVFLEPGQSEDVEIELDKHAVAFWDEVLKCWICEQGRYQVLVGSSSADIRLRGELIMEETWTWTGL